MSCWSSRGTLTSTTGLQICFTQIRMLFQPTQSTPVIGLGKNQREVDSDFWNLLSDSAVFGGPQQLMIIEVYSSSHSEISTIDFIGNAPAGCHLRGYANSSRFPTHFLNGKNVVMPIPRLLGKQHKFNV